MDARTRSEYYGLLNKGNECAEAAQSIQSAIARVQGLVDPEVVEELRAVRMTIYRASAQYTVAADALKSGKVA